MARTPATKQWRWTARASAAVLAAALLSAVPAASPDPAPGNLPAAEAAVLFGHDISWPQCTAAEGGFDLPLPPADTAFVIVGLTKGLAFTENPCLARQVKWVKDRNKRAHAYGMATFPTAAQLTAHGTSGPWTGTARAARLSNAGYAEARAAAASMRKVAWDPAVVWIDVEPRPAQPWPGGTVQRQVENRYVVEGYMRGLRDAGFAYGLYSYTSGWQQIVGNWRLPGVPVWATAGTLDYPNEALDRCTQASFSGGRVYLSQWTDGTRDYNRTCGTYAFTALPIPAPTQTGSIKDFTSDWRNDLLARDRSGRLWIYPGNGTGGWQPRRLAGTGWNGMGLLAAVGDLSGDGKPDLLARENATGYLWLYRGNGSGGWLPRVRAGNGWNVMDALAGAGDLDGDGRADLLAREKATGYLWLYRGNGTGGFLPRQRLGGGWNTMNELAAPGDFNGDGRADLLARERATGYLWLYRGTGTGGWQPRVRVGTGWNVMDALAAPGDFNGSRTADLLAREKATGYLWLYRGNGAGGWIPRLRVGTGWSGMTALD